MFCQWFYPLEHLSVSSEDKSYPVHGLIHEGKKLFFFCFCFCFLTTALSMVNPLEQQHSTKAKLKSGI